MYSVFTAVYGISFDRELKNNSNFPFDKDTEGFFKELGIIEQDYSGYGDATSYIGKTYGSLEVVSDPDVGPGWEAYPDDVTLQHDWMNCVQNVLWEIKDRLKDQSMEFNDRQELFRLMDFLKVVKPYKFYAYSTS
jgi:hypothetical protein